MIHQEEILENILHRLPAKSIGRFRCVSKPWISLLSQPHFIKAHLNRTRQLSITEISILLVSKEESDEYETNQNGLAHSSSLYSIQLKSTDDETTSAAASLPSRLNIGDHRFANNRTVVKVQLASCDGLVLVRDEDEKLLLVNPTTRETKALPASPYALKPDDSHIRYGLGYDSSTDDYKVVTIAFYGDCYHYYYGQYLSEPDPDAKVRTVCVYSVKNGTWKRVANSPYVHDDNAQSGVYVNGHIHWIASETSSYPNYKWRWVIAAFDLKEERFHEVPPPSLDGHYWGFGGGHLAVVEGCLCLLPSSSPRYYRDDDDFNESPDKYFRTIFVMKQYNVEGSWTAFTAVDYENSKIRPLCSLGKDQMVVLMTEHPREEIQKKLVIYNTEGRSKDIGFPNEFYVIGTFIESLVSPHCICSDEAVN